MSELNAVKFKIPCNEWNTLFGIAGAMAGINCKLGLDHEGEHEVVITLGHNPAVQHTIHWKTIESG